MKKHNIDAYIVPTSDAHQSEYVADRFKVREWLSGFSGSAGLLVVTHEHAGLWTDSRYFQQAETELATSDFQLHKITNRNFPEHIIWINNNLPQKSKIACNGMLFSKGEIENYQKLLAKAKIELNYSLDFADAIWDERPTSPQSKIYAHDTKYTGKTRLEKLEQLRNEFLGESDSYLVTALDDTAWLLNLRAQDVDYNPVFYSYVLVEKDQAFLFVDESKLSQDIKAKLSGDGLVLKPYDGIVAYVNELEESHRMHIVNGDISMSLYKAINAETVAGKNFIRHAKGVKNVTEVDNVRNAMEKDGVALTRTFMWLEGQLTERKVKETEVREQLAHFRSQQELYVGESFGAIVGYKGNGAMIHYSPEENTCADIGNDGMLLVDSGAQYLDGTTDTTRTFHTGSPSNEEKKAFTLVLKGYIALDTVKYPEGTKGIQIDALARMHLWDQGMDYGHGTGHGVGFLLNVHEGPQGFASGWGARTKTVLLPGMITSNEPGFYKVGEFGIRIENLILTVEDKVTVYGKFLSHETLTMFPIEIKLVEEALLSPQEKAWFNHYHLEVYRRLSPRLEAHEQKWLNEKCGLLK